MPAFASLEMPLDAPWKRNLVLLEWTEMICVQARSFHPACGKYLRKSFEDAWTVFMSKVNPTQTVDPRMEEMDARLVALLMVAMPDRVKTQIYRMRGSESVVAVLCCMYVTLNPGGEEEASSIVKFTRGPGGCKSAADAREKVEDWIQARSRLSMVGYSDLACRERVDALTEIVQQNFKSSPEASHRWQLQRFSERSRHPDEKYCNELQEWVLSELRMMENNEMIAHNVRKQGGDTWDRRR